jgi:hypothetical protein
MAASTAAGISVHASGEERVRKKRGAWVLFMRHCPALQWLCLAAGVARRDLAGLCVHYYFDSCRRFMCKRWRLK